MVNTLETEPRGNNLTGPEVATVSAIIDEE